MSGRQGEREKDTMTYAIRIIQRSNRGDNTTTHDFGASHPEFSGHNDGDRKAVRDALAMVAALEGSRINHVRAVVFDVEEAEKMFRDQYPHDFTSLDYVRGWHGESFDN
jgi:hypothetical protein